MNYPGLENLTPEMVFAKYRKKKEETGYSLTQVQAVFNNKAFRENPYRFVLEDLIDYKPLNFRAPEVPTRVLMLGLPQFKKKVTMELVREIAQDRFKANVTSSEMVEIFNRIKGSSTFVHFEFYRNHANPLELGILLRELFAGIIIRIVFITAEKFLNTRD